MMRDKLLQIKHILNTKSINGFLVQGQNKMLRMSFCPDCERPVRNNDYIMRKVKEFLLVKDYDDLVINIVGREIYINKVRKSV